jgi:hypothetical protein
LRLVVPVPSRWTAIEQMPDRLAVGIDAPCVAVAPAGTWKSIVSSAP